MKIYWKNLIWNYTVRYWFKLKLRGKSKSWKNYYCTKLVWNSKQKAELEKKIREELKKLGKINTCSESYKKAMLHLYWIWWGI
jgi:hypothetical protein